MEAPAGETDQLTLEQINSIQAGIAESQPMVGAAVPVISLLDTYKEAHLPGFALGIQALWFGYLEKVLTASTSDDAKLKQTAEDELLRMTTKIRGSLQELVAVGYPEFAIESFHEELMEILEGLLVMTVAELEEMFQEGGKADYLTWFMRVLTAGHLKLNCDRFLPFVEGLYMDMDAFCKAEVEPMNKECEQLQILALCEYLDIRAEIAYLDGRFSELEGVRTVCVPEEGGQWTIQLLYRPGHYDLLYKVG